MKISEMNFRELAYNYVLFSDVKPEKFGVYSQTFSSEPGDNAVLTYGYIDNQAGLSFEVLCCARKNSDGSIELRDSKDDTSFKIRYGGIEGGC